MDTATEEGLLLGIDVGTSSCKVGLYTAQGELVAEAGAGYGLERPALGWVEQEPEDWWTAAQEAIKAALANAGGRRVVAIGLCGQSPTLALLGADGKALCRAILWQDTRADAESRALWEAATAIERLAWFGLDLPPSPSWTAPRLAWLRTHRPDLLVATTAVLQPKDWVGYRLTGQVYSDRWTMRGMVNVRSGECHPDLLRALDLPARLLPHCYRPFDTAGYVMPAVATVLGLPVGIPVAAGWADGLCGILGSGALAGRAGEQNTRGFIISGSSEVVGITGSDDGSPSPGVLRAPVYEEGHAFVFGPTQSSGDALRWIARIIDPEHGEERLPAIIEQVIQTSDPAQIIFLPYLAGERAPIWDAAARGAFYGLTLAHRREDMVRAVLEGIAYSDRHVLDAAALGGVFPAQVIIAGGGARSGAWNQLRADVLGATVMTCAIQEGGTLGAAILGSVVAGIYPTLREASTSMVRIAGMWSPNPETVQLYRQAYRNYLALYPSLRSITR